MPVLDLPALKEAVPAGRLMALDVGSKTIGVATSDALRMLATPVTTVRRGKLAADLASLADLVTRHQIKALVIGLPLNMDGSEGPRCQSVRQFAANIERHAPPSLAALPVVFQDERLSTAAVTRGMIDDYDMSRAKRAERVDAAAAAWILEIGAGAPALTAPDQGQGSGSGGGRAGASADSVRRKATRSACCPADRPSGRTSGVASLCKRSGLTSE